MKDGMMMKDGMIIKAFPHSIQFYSFFIIWSTENLIIKDIVTFCILMFQ